MSIRYMISNLLLRGVTAGHALSLETARRVVALYSSLKKYYTGFIFLLQQIPDKNTIAHSIKLCYNI